MNSAGLQSRQKMLEMSFAIFVTTSIRIRNTTDGVLILEEDARMFWEITKSISRHVLSPVGKSP